ncbi:MAG: hypothetical protein GX574_14295 [Lentisphaerae bacterium]|nr:hypothetical protein [Lentisphaerota bacterium]
MPKKNSVLVPLFRETFASETDGLPGGWQVEQNTDLPQVPAIRAGEGCIELLSGGNKYLPVIPDTADAQVRMTCSVSYEEGARFGFILCFRYDTLVGRGQYVRLTGSDKEKTVTFEYGTTRLNHFTPVQTKTMPADTALMAKPMTVTLEIRGASVKVEFLEQKAGFRVKAGSGRIALAREHFWDVLKVLDFSIDGDPPRQKGKEKTFTLPMPDSLTWYPIFCDVTLRDYGSCMDAELSFRGGVAETQAGEGNYHGMRADLLTRPYLKILTAERAEKHVLYGKTIVLVPQGIAPKYLYKLIYEKVDWPFCRNVRFLKPTGDFDLAAGFESWHHNASPNLELNPAETVFTINGKVLYSGEGITPGEQRKIEFLSQENKAILKKLPKSDPRLDLAEKFAKANHYFFEKEAPAFRIRLTSSQPLPARFEVTLEDAFLRSLSQLKYDMETHCTMLGVSPVNVVELTLEKLSGLDCGVYHLRVRSADPSTPPLEDYCAFEIMSRKHDAPPPPLLSGLPFLYNARTETRGLMTDAFDPWIGASVNEGHYISCAVMLPAAVRQYRMLPTLKAYSRSNFSWISARTLDNPKPEDNTDIIKESDYINIADRNERMNLTWAYSYHGQRFQMMIDFLKTLNDPAFDLESLQEMQKKGEAMPVEIYLKVAEQYWEKWLDYACRVMAEWTRDMQKKMRKINPRVQFAQYGPFHIYAAALKGPECPRMLGNAEITPDLNAFWQFEDYPFSCGYGLERGAYTLTGCLLAMPGSAIYPEIYTGGKLKQGCPDGAVFYAHPPFGSSIGAKERSPRLMIQYVVNYVYASGHLTAEGFRYWTRQGFQACRFTREWYEALLEIWPVVLEHPADRPLRSAAFVSSEDSWRTNQNRIIFGKGLIDVRNTATEDVPFVYEASRRAGVCAGFQLFDSELGKLTAEQVDTLVLPPLKGMSKAALKQIRRLHAQGVNLVASENVTGLEDLFGVVDTGKMSIITQVTPIGDFCRGLNEYCDDERCQGSYAVSDAEVLLQAEIPVLTLKRNAKASAAFFNVPPHLVRSSRLHARVGYGKNSISQLMEAATGELMKRFSKTGIKTTGGRLLACHTKDNAILVVVYNPDMERELITEITLSKKLIPSPQPEVNREITLLREDSENSVFRALLPPNEVLVMVFS